MPVFAHPQQRHVKGREIADGGIDIVTRAASTTYDAQGRFATSATNALGQSESWQQDPRFGLPTSHTGPNNHGGGAHAGLASVVDIASGAILKSLPVGEEPEGVAIRPDGGVVLPRWRRCSSSCRSSLASRSLSSGSIVDTLRIFPWATYGFPAPRFRSLLFAMG